MRESLLVFTGLWFSICLPALRKVQDYVMEEKKFEDLEDLLFRLHVVIVGGSSCISTMYYLLL
jgi:hypothetical protein